LDAIAARADCVASYEEALSRSGSDEYDIWLLDYQLGETSGVELLRAIRTEGLTMPVVILTGMGDERVAVEAMKAGAADYLRKERLSTELLGGAIRHALDLYKQEELRKRAEEALRKAKEDLEIKVEQRTTELRRANENLEAEIRERERAQKVLTQQNQELEALNKLLKRTERLSAAGEVAAGVAHQINNPLTAIIGRIHLLLKNLESNAPGYDSLVAIQEAAEQAGAVVQRMLNLARSTPYVMQPTDLNASIQNSISLVRAQIGPGVRLVSALATQLPAVNASKEHLGDVWVNLILNAGDALAESENGTLRIASRHDTKDHTVEVIVEDNGHGVPPEILDRIFDPFFTTKQYGTGLGLSVCDDVVARHGGSIKVDSAGISDHGTKFTVTLPVYVPEE
jgi:C4-dicarboxylate-specific signal transduction histidine kinase